MKREKIHADIAELHFAMSLCLTVAALEQHPCRVIVLIKSVERITRDHRDSILGEDNNTFFESFIETFAKALKEEILELPAHPSPPDEWAPLAKLTCDAPLVALPIIVKTVKDLVIEDIKGGAILSLPKLVVWLTSEIEDSNEVGVCDKVENLFNILFLCPENASFAFKERSG